jgi:hypothetical protein
MGYRERVGKRQESKANLLEPFALAKKSLEFYMLIRSPSLVDFFKSTGSQKGGKNEWSKVCHGVARCFLHAHSSLCGREEMG